jgi:hypothetical protein
LTTFVGAISFVVTGPLTGLLLGPYVRDDSIHARAFSGLFFLVSLPVLSFEVLAYSSSVLPLFMIFGPWTERNMLMFYGEAALLALATYVVYSVAMFWQVRRGFLPGLLTAVLLSAGSFAILVFRFLHG